MNRIVLQRKNTKIAGTNPSWTAEKQFKIAVTNRACGDKVAENCRNESSLKNWNNSDFSCELFQFKKYPSPITNN